jgi:3-phosphoglycerate kinase
MIKSVEDAFLEHKTVLVRADLNVPLTSDGNVADDTRITASLPTIDNIIDKAGIPVIISHLGRPKGEKNLKYSLKPVADYFADILGYNVKWADDCIGDSPKEVINSAEIGDIVILENLRFYKEETANDADFAKELSELADVYVNDAFGAAHRAHASTAKVAEYFEEKYAGLLMLNELTHLKAALEKPAKPFTAVIGGAKISGKIDVIKNLFDKCDNILIGGGMMFTFYKAKGMEIGNSLLEADKVDLAASLIKEAEQKGVNLILPDDVTVGKEFKNETEYFDVDVNSIPNDMIGLDIGSKTADKYFDIVAKSKTIVWNGPMGVFEMDNFAKGTLKIAEAMADATLNGAKTIVGGGDSAAAIKKLNYDKKVSHVSTGGGASLEYLEGKTLPGVDALEI